MSTPAVTAAPGAPLVIKSLTDSHLKTDLNATTATILHLGVSVLDTENNAICFPESMSNLAVNSKYTILCLVENTLSTMSEPEHGYDTDDSINDACDKSNTTILVSFDVASMFTTSKPDLDTTFTTTSLA